MSLDLFSDNFLTELELFQSRFLSDYEIEMDKKVFDTLGGLKILSDKGWDISNHGIRHFPVSSHRSLEAILSEFEENENEILRNFGFTTNHWVIPFDHDWMYNYDLLREHTKNSIVLVRDKVNYNQKNPKIIYRINPPISNSNDLMKKLISVSNK